jgi:group I intron endonuclease
VCKYEKDNKFYNAISKYGTECWFLEILEEVEDINLLNEREIYWIEHYDTFKSGYNSTLGGKQNTIVSEETRLKMSLAKSGKNNPFFKKHHSKESREKIALSNKGENGSFYGKHHSEKTKKKIRLGSLGENNHNYGKHHSKETKEKMKQAWRIRNNNEKF